MRALVALGSYVRQGYDRRSLVALATLVTTGAIVGYRWSDLVDVNGGMDWLLFATWIVMAALLTWQVSLRNDLTLVAVGFVGGGVIEWWGTTSQIWTYFTLERPPLWILPAWPIAALAIDRIARLLDRTLSELRERPIHERWFVRAYWLMLPVFVLAMASFSWHTRHVPSTLAVLCLMVGVTLHCPNPRRDVMIFVAGSFLGVFLEYWGTSRECWTYYTRQVPPPVATFAHGFASVAFARGASAVSALVDRVLARAPLSARSLSDNS